MYAQCLRQRKKKFEVKVEATPALAASRIKFRKQGTGVRAYSRKEAADEGGFGDAADC